MFTDRKVNFFKNDIEVDEQNLFVDKPTDYKPDIEFQKWLKRKKREAEIEENKEVAFLNPINLKTSIFYKIRKNMKNVLYFQLDDLGFAKNEAKLERTKSQLINYYYNLNIKKYMNIIKKSDKNNYFKYDNYILMIIDVRKQKPMITVINDNKTFLFLTAGIVFSKMKMKEKKNKKGEKMIVTMLKLVFNEIIKKINNKNLLINIKGLTSNIEILYSTIESYSNNFKFLFLNSQHKRRNKLKFKKIKSIKRRLKKRFIKESNYD